MGSVTSHTGTKHSHRANRKRQKNRPFPIGALTALVVRTINEDHMGKRGSFKTDEIREKLRRQGRNLRYLPIVLNRLYMSGAIGLHGYEVPYIGHRFVKVYYARKKIAYRPNRHTRKYLERYNLT